MVNSSVQIQKFLFSLTKQIKADFEQELATAHAGVTGLQYGTLALLQKLSGAATLNELAQELLLKPPSLVPTIDSLEHDGYIHREQDSNDRRKIQLMLTDKGKKLLTDIPMPNGAKSLNLALEKIGPEKTQKILELLAELTEQFKK